MVNPFSVTSSGRPTVVVDDPAEAIAELHQSRRQADHVGGLSEAVGCIYSSTTRNGIVLITCGGRDRANSPSCEGACSPLR